MDTFQQVLALQTKVTAQIKKQAFQAATETQLDALKLAQGLDKPKLMALLYQNLGQILEQKGDLQKTVYAYEAAFKALNREDHQLAATSKRLRQARKSFHEDAKIEIPDVFSPSVATSLEEALKAKDLNLKLLIHIGNSYFLQPQLLPALNAYQQVLAQTNIEKQPLLKAQTLIKIGEIFRQQKKIDLAQQKIESALALFKEHGKELDQRFALALQARLHFQAQQIDLAIPTYQKAVTLFEQIEDYKNLSKVLAQMGQLFLGMGDFKQAKASYLKALSYAQTTHVSDLEWHLFWGLGCCYWDAKDWNQAAIFYEKSKTKILKRQDKLFTDEGKVAFLDSVQDVFNRLIETYLHIGTTESIQKAFAVTEMAKGQSLSDLMQGRNRRRAQHQQSLLGSINFPSANNPIQQMSSAVPIITSPAPDTDTDEFNQILAALEEEQPHAMIRQDAASEMASANAIPDFSINPLEVNETNVKKLAVRSVSKRHYLCFYMLTNKLLIWLKKPDGQLVFHEWLIPRDQLIKKVSQFRNALVQDAQNRGHTIKRGVERVEEEVMDRGVIARPVIDSQSDLVQLSEEFYQQLWLPFQAILSAEKTIIVLIPHDVLWQFPYAALKDTEGQYVGNQYALLYSPSIKALAQIDKEAPYSQIEDAKALIIGNPVMSQADKRYRFMPLKGAETEAVELGKLFRTKPLLQAAATHIAVEKEIAETNILHFATHGMADEQNPLDSYIVLADHLNADGSLEKTGLLKARKIMYWSVPCELVNLSACQTALGKISGEGIIGLSRAFLVAGSRSVLVSLWNISDEATAIFMLQFYKYYFKLGNKGLALQKTIQQFQNLNDYSHPIYWSAFTLVGSDD